MRRIVLALAVMAPLAFTTSSVQAHPGLFGHHGYGFGQYGHANYAYRGIGPSSFRYAAPLSTAQTTVTALAPVTASTSASAELVHRSEPLEPSVTATATTPASVGRYAEEFYPSSAAAAIEAGGERIAADDKTARRTTERTGAVYSRFVQVDGLVPRRRAG